MQPPLLCVIGGRLAEWRYYVDDRLPRESL